MTDELQDLLDRAKAAVEAMTPTERADMLRQQRESMARLYYEGGHETRVVVVGADTPMLPQAPLATSQTDFRSILLSLVATLAGSEVSGDVSEDIWQALVLAGIRPPADIDTDEKLADWLGTEFGAVSVWSARG